MPRTDDEVTCPHCLYDIDQCECHNPSPDEMRRMKALYEGEKAAGLHKSREEYEAEMRDAGRGHLLGKG